MYTRIVYSEETANQITLDGQKYLREMLEAMKEIGIFVPLTTRYDYQR